MIERLSSDPTIRQFAKFLVVGVVNTAFGYLVYALFVWIGLAPQPALALAFVIGVAWNFLGHARYVFGTKGFARLPHYIGSYALIYVVNALALAQLWGFGMHSLAAQAVLAPIAAVASFFMIGKALTGRFPVFQ